MDAIPSLASFRHLSATGLLCSGFDPKEVVLHMPFSRRRSEYGFGEYGFKLGFGKRGLLEKGSFQKSPCLEIPENREILENPPNCGKQRRIRPSSRDSREFRDFRDSREETPFVMTPFSLFLTNTELSEFSGPHQVPERELSKFL